MPKRKSPQKPKPTPATQPLALPPDSAPAVVEAPNPTRDTLYRLVNGAEPANPAEKLLLFRWHHLSKWERYALAYAWDLPYPQQEHARLAGQAVEKLERII